MLRFFVSVVFMAGFGLVVRASHGAGCTCWVGLLNYLRAALFYGVDPPARASDLRLARWPSALLGAAFYGGGFFSILAPCAGAAGHCLGDPGPAVLLPSRLLRPVA